MKKVFENDRYTIMKDDFGDLGLELKSKAQNFVSFSIDENLKEYRDKIKAVVVLDQTTAINANMFDGFSKLERVHFPVSLQRINGSAFNDCSKLETIILPPNLEEIGFKAFAGCSNIKSVSFDKSLKRISSQAFFKCKNLKQITLPETTETVEMYAFGNSGIESLTIKRPLKSVGGNAFFISNSFYLQTLKNGQVTISKNPISNLPEEVENKHYNLSNISVFDLGKLLTFDNIAEELNIYQNLNNKLKGSNNYISYRYLQKKNREEFLDFVNNANMRFYKKENCFYNFLEDIGDYYAPNFFAFAEAIGCFSQNEQLSQRANVWLSEIISKDKLDSHAVKEGFKDLVFKGENLEFAEFLFPLNHGENLDNFEQIMQNYGPEFLVKIYEEFANMNNDGRNAIFRDESGRLKFKVYIDSIKGNGEKVTRVRDHKPTVELFAEYFAEKQFENIRVGNESVAKELSRWQGMQQRHFDIAQDIMDEYRCKHIAQEIIPGAKQLLKDQNHVGKYSWEFLEKDDPRNFTLGLYCDCCANITDTGHSIMKINFVNSDVQNLVFKNKNDVIIGKATLYVDRKNGNGIYNTVEIANRISLIDREEIYTNFVEATDTFVKVYNMHNDVKIKKMVVGNCATNDLLQCFDKNYELIQPLKGVPTEYQGTYISFGGTMKQYLVYNAEKTNIKEENDFEM